MLELGLDGDAKKPVQGSDVEQLEMSAGEEQMKLERHSNSGYSYNRSSLQEDCRIFLQSTIDQSPTHQNSTDLHI